MSVFLSYAKYYDALYADKDYLAEAEYVHGLIERFNPGSRDVLDLGCGTGCHAIRLAERGYRVTGVDRSDAMLDRARARSEKTPGLRTRLTWSCGDVRSVDIECHFDAVVSLFHVASYQTENGDFSAMLDVARHHLRLGGVFVFDFWYGPAVLSDRPVPRVKRVTTPTAEIVRIAEPELLPNDNSVDVSYQLFAEDMETSATVNVREKHRMRYFFLPELRGFLERAHFAPHFCGEWMTQAPCSLSSWSGVVAAKAV
jgi:SAM-dependent methyltransferase